MYGNPPPTCHSLNRSSYHEFGYTWHWKLSDFKPLLLVPRTSQDDPLNSIIHHLFDNDIEISIQLMHEKDFENIRDLLKTIFGKET